MAIKYVEEPLPAAEIIDFKIQSWYGLNKNNGNFRTGEFKNCMNMSGEHFPYAAPRKPREVIKSGIINPQKLFFNDDKMGYIADGEFYYDGEYKGDCGDTKSVVVYDDRIYTFPSNRYYDVENDEYLGVLSWINLDKFSIKNSDKTCVQKDTDYHRNYSILFETEILSMYENQKTVTIGYSGIKPDCVYIRFFYNGEPIISDSEEKWETLPKYKDGISVRTTVIDGNTEYADGYVLYFGYHHITSAGTLNVDDDDKARCSEDFKKIVNSEGKVWINEVEYPASGSVPTISYTCEFNNRIVGIHGDDIYTSSLGSMNDWTTTDTETGAYATDVGTLGDFTGIIKYNGMVFMFKPDVVHQLYGTGLPFYVSEAFKTGCVDGRTICEVNNALYWLGREGVYTYSGGMPRLISKDVFEGYQNGTACTDGRNYYICLNDGSNYETFVYDSYTGLWHRYDETPYVDLACSEGCVYGLTAGGDIIKFDSGNERVNWSFETHDMNFGMNRRKNVSKVWIRADMKPNTMLDVYVSSNGGEYKRVAHYTAESETMFDFKVRIKKTDSFSFKFEGVGDVKILDIHAKVKVGTAKHRAGDDLDVYR